MLEINPTDLYFDINAKCQYSVPVEFIHKAWVSVKDERKKKLEKGYMNQSFKTGQKDLDIFDVKVKNVECCYVSNYPGLFPILTETYTIANDGIFLQQDCVVLYSLNV